MDLRRWSCLVCLRLFLVGNAVEDGHDGGGDGTPEHFHNPYESGGPNPFMQQACHNDTQINTGDQQGHQPPASYNTGCVPLQNYVPLQFYVLVPVVRPFLVHPPNATPICGDIAQDCDPWAAPQSWDFHGLVDSNGQPIDYDIAQDPCAAGSCDAPGSIAHQNESYEQPARRSLRGSQHGRQQQTRNHGTGAASSWEQPARNDGAGAASSWEQPARNDGPGAASSNPLSAANNSAGEDKPVYHIKMCGTEADVSFERLDPPPCKPEERKKWAEMHNIYYQGVEPTPLVIKCLLYSAPCSYCRHWLLSCCTRKSDKRYNCGCKYSHGPNAQKRTTEDEEAAARQDAWQAILEPLERFLATLPDDVPDDEAQQQLGGQQEQGAQPQQEDQGTMLGMPSAADEDDEDAEVKSEGYLN